VTEAGTLRRVEAYRASARLLMAVESLREVPWNIGVGDGRPAGLSRGPQRHLAPLGSGEKVIADANADEAAFLRSVNYKVAAVDMEAAGIANAIYEHASPPELLVVRGVSDRADRDKNDDYHRYAARSAAEFLVALLARLPRLVGEAQSAVADALGILVHCPGGLPLQVLASAVALPADALLPDLRDLAAGSHLRLDEWTSWAELTPEGAKDAESQRPDLLLLALEEGMAFASRQGSGPDALRILPSLCELARVSATRYPRACARVFKAIEKGLKRAGDKHQILNVARLSIDAAHHVPADLRTRDEVELEAQAVICGLSWVYQRTGRLGEAMREAERSLELGKTVHYDRNTAFCQKCIGRLLRLQAESATGATKARLLAESVRSIHEAIEGFSRHPDFGPDDPEVGACYSLLARTLLVRGDLAGAQKAAETAWTIITDPEGKDYLDLEIVSGEIEFASGDRAKAMAYFDAVISAPKPAEAERSEILARAHLARADCRRRLSMKTEALADCDTARKISEGLREHEEVARAAWLAAKTRGEITEEMEGALGNEPYSVRTRVLGALSSEAAAPRSRIAQRSKRTSSQWQRLIGQARERLAIEELPW
jgi:tetratricopeptide (TPR) repeat protein